MTQAEFSAPAERNKQPILEVLQRVLPRRGMALEVASGTGQHVTWFGAAMRSWLWQPTDADPRALATIAARTAQAGLTNVREPLHLDVLAAQWLPDDAQGTQKFDQRTASCQMLRCTRH